MATTNPLSPQLLKEIVETLAADFAANPEFGTPGEKISLLLRAMVAKCIFCMCGPKGEVLLYKAAECANDDCPLNPYGPAAFKMVRAKLEFQGGVAGGVH